MSGAVFMEKLPKNIQVIFDNNLNLSELIPNPRLISNSPFIFALSQKLNYLAKSNENEYLYRVVFKKGSSRELMTINSGELKGLPTTTCIEKGRISGVAGLEKFELDNQSDLMPALLGISLYSSIQNSLSYISDLCSDIRNHQILEGQARFERISETIVDIFKSIPDLSLDRSLRDAYLSRIVKNNDDCYELYIFQIEKFKISLNERQRNCDSYFEYKCNKFVQEVLSKPIFSVFERLVAGRICEIVLSGNYSDSNIKRHKDFISKAQNKIEDAMKWHIMDLDTCIRNQEQQLEQNYMTLTGYQLKNEKSNLDRHISLLEEVKRKIYTLLDAKLNSFDVLSELMSQDEIDVFLIGGNLIVNDMQLTPD